jgi:hypothetical protein
VGRSAGVSGSLQTVEKEIDGELETRFDRPARLEVLAHVGGHVGELVNRKLGQEVLPDAGELLATRW